MFLTLYKVFVTSALAIMLIVGPVTPINVASAEVTAADIEAQQKVVLLSMVEVLRENVKLLQLRLIDRLETQVALLEAQVAARNK